MTKDLSHLTFEEVEEAPLPGHGLPDHACQVRAPFSNLLSLGSGRSFGLLCVRDLRSLHLIFSLLAVLRDPQPGLCRALQLSFMQEMVLQLSRQHIRRPYCHAFGAFQAQGGAAARR